MTGKEWRSEVNRFVERLEKELSWVFKADANESVAERICREKAEAEIRVVGAVGVINQFKDKYLNPETCDDFDEV